MWTRGNLLGLFSVEFEFMACHVTVGWVTPSVHIVNGVNKSYSSLDVALMPCAVVLNAHTRGGIICHAVMR